VETLALVPVQRDSHEEPCVNVRAPCVLQRILRNEIRDGLRFSRKCKRLLL